MNPIAKEKGIKKFGPYAFYLALILAVVLAFLPTGYKATATLVLAILGLVVGWLNITEKEMMGFLVSCLAWMVAGSSLSAIIDKLSIPVAGPFIVSVLGNVVTIVAPAAALVSIMHLYSMTKD